MFNLDLNPAEIQHHFSSDPILGPLVHRNPALRLPAAFDPFEQAVRAVVGQQVSVKAAVTITGRIAQRLGMRVKSAPSGMPDLLFPGPRDIAQGDLSDIGMPSKRAGALQNFASAIVDGRLDLTNTKGADALVAALCKLPGIGPWTAEYIALRAFGEPDAFPASDLGLLKAPVWGEGGMNATDLKQRAEAWRPRRAYAAIHLWQDYSPWTASKTSPPTHISGDL
jgi:DNA-3-methyladenine glycosylase II